MTVIGSCERWIEFKLSFFFPLVPWTPFLRSLCYTSSFERKDFILFCFFLYQSSLGGKVPSVTAETFAFMQLISFSPFGWSTKYYPHYLATLISLPGAKCWWHESESFKVLHCLCNDAFLGDYFVTYRSWASAQAQTLPREPENTSICQSKALLSKTESWPQMCLRGISEMISRIFQNFLFQNVFVTNDDVDPTLD